jgi:hypothetical protein
MDDVSDETFTRAGLTLNQDGRESSRSSGGSREKPRELLAKRAQCRAGTE